MMRKIMKKNLILLSIITFGFAYNGSITGVTYFDYTCENDASAFNFNRQYFNYAIEMSNNEKIFMNDFIYSLNFQFKF